MYEERYPLDWESLDRDEAVERAFALGVAEELGEEHPEEYARLVGVLGRPLAEMAHDEGSAKAKDLREAIEADEETVADRAFPDRDHEIWSRFVGHVRDASDVESSKEQDRAPLHDLPALLDGFDLSGNPVKEDGRDRLKLPDFLYR